MGYNYHNLYLAKKNNNFLFLYGLNSNYYCTQLLESTPTWMFLNSGQVLGDIVLGDQHIGSPIF